ncbi:Imm21 family immunity protein [Streptomyces bobili]|uniref:Imm21 family immunity protein n=1 Tax=Streptomyces bobili TaxID=67280 RepID=UPI0034423E61
MYREGPPRPGLDLRPDVIVYAWPGRDSKAVSQRLIAACAGPLVVTPVFAVAAWRGCTETGVMAGDATASDDCDRTCAVDDLAGVITRAMRQRLAHPGASPR